MKKLISTLMVGIVASACAMTTMAAPSFDHRAGPAPHQMDKKPMPPKHGMNQGSKFNSKQNHFNQNNHKGSNDRFDKNVHKPSLNKFDQKQHNNQFKNDVNRGHGPDPKAPPMPPKHR